MQRTPRLTIPCGRRPSARGQISGNQSLDVLGRNQLRVAKCPVALLGIRINLLGFSQFAGQGDHQDLRWFGVFHGLFARERRSPLEVSLVILRQAPFPGVVNSILAVLFKSRIDLGSSRSSPVGIETRGKDPLDGSASSRMKRKSQPGRDGRLLQQEINLLLGDGPRLTGRFVLELGLGYGSPFSE